MPYTHIAKPDNDIWAWVSGVLARQEQIAVDQIKFPAVQVPSTDANVLDDYEEGTWTPAIEADVGTITSYTHQVGLYVKIGRNVIITADIQINVLGTLAGTFTVLTGLPFTAETIASGVVAAAPFGYFFGLATNWSSLGGQVASNSTSALIQGVSGTQGTGMVNLTGTDFANGARVIATIAYRAAA